MVHFIGAGPWAPGPSPPSGGAVAPGRGGRDYLRGQPWQPCPPDHKRESCTVYDTSAGMTLEEVLAVMKADRVRRRDHTVRPP